MSISYIYITDILAGASMHFSCMAVATTDDKADVKVTALS
jgi:hypothetical protein